MSASLAEAVDRVRSGGLVAYPTETVWGLGADARSASALASLQAWKGRDPGQPISVLVESAAALAPLGFRVTPAAQRLAEAFWPGPLTLVLACRGGFAPGVAGAEGAVGVRCSSHPVAAALAAALAKEDAGPLTSTSFNRRGDPPVRTAVEARALCAESEARVAPREAEVLALELSGAPEPSGEPSTVVDASGARPRVLRWGAVEAAALEAVLKEESRV